MIVIIGGFAQGKTEYARQNYENADGRIFYLNDRVRELFDNGIETEEELARLIEPAPDCICITDEVGRGVVPIDRREMLLRELAGRMQIRFAARADEVVRVTCGIGQKIKG